MRYAFPGSAVLHIGAATIGYVLMGWQTAPQPPKAESVVVDLIGTSTFSSNQPSIIQSDATENMIAAGSQSQAAQPTETLEPEQPEEIEPQPQPEEPKKIEQSEPAEPVETAPAARILSASVDAQMIEPIRPVQSETDATRIDSSAVTESITPDVIKPVEAAQPIEGTEAVLPPVPRMLQASRPEKPTVRPKPKVEKKPQKSTPKPAQSGSGGQSNANSRASFAASSPAVSNYPGKVQSRLRRALRYPSSARGVSGTAQVQFVIAANGAASAIRIVKSTGNTVLDEAALATVRRASPFPAIPDEAGRNVWQFTIPLMFTN